MKEDGGRLKRRKKRKEREGKGQKEVMQPRTTKPQVPRGGQTLGSPHGGQCQCYLRGRQEPESRVG